MEDPKGEEVRGEGPQAGLRLGVRTGEGRDCRRELWVASAQGGGNRETKSQEKKSLEGMGRRGAAQGPVSHTPPTPDAG